MTDDRRPNRFTATLYWTLVAGLALLAAALTLPARSQPGGAEPLPARGPTYDDEGRLLLPEDYRRWVFVGSSLGLSYSEGGGSHEMFHETLMEPSAYDHFTRTGRFRDGTMLVLMLHGTGEGELPQRRGRFAAEVHGVEMAVKDAAATEEGWAYYGFGGMNGIRDRAEAFAADACYSCHAEHAAHDNVFLQFYPLLAEAAPPGTELRPTLRRASLPTTEAVPPEEQVVDVAVGGLDPVLLVDGREELGKPEIVATHRGWTYQFVSEPTRARFAGEPDRYAIQNESCPVVPGAAIDPGIFTLHQGRLYAFATTGCRDDFLEDPAAYLGGGDGREAGANASP